MSAAWAEVVTGVVSGLGGAFLVTWRAGARWARIESDVSHLKADVTAFRAIA